MDERPLDPGARLSAEAHDAHGDRRSRSRAGAESDRHGDGHRRRGRSSSIATPTTARTGSFILIDPATHFTGGAGMITDPLRDAVDRARGAAQRRRAAGALARRAASDDEAAEAVRKALEEMLT